MPKGYNSNTTKDLVKDVPTGTISLDQAREAYGVVLDEETLELDNEATARLRGA